MHFCTSREKVARCASRPNFVAARQLNPNLVICYLKAKIANFRRPYIVGVYILDMAKEQMFDDYYNLLVPALDEKVSLMMTDTDSFLLHIESDNLYEVLEKHKDRFDFSNLKPTSRLYSKENQKVLGKWKIESGKVLGLY